MIIFRAAKIAILESSKLGAISTTSNPVMGLTSPEPFLFNHLFNLSHLPFFKSPL
jgi:hypothetical protein